MEAAMEHQASFKVVHNNQTLGLQREFHIFMFHIVCPLQTL